MKDIYGLEIEMKDQVFISDKETSDLILGEVIKISKATVVVKVVGVFNPSKRYLLGYNLTRKPWQVIRQTEFIDEKYTLYCKED